MQSKESKAGGAEDVFYLYRGVVDEEIQFIDKEVRLDNRRPLNMNPLLHKKINIYMKDNFGHPYRNAMFCTGDMDSAEYGKNTYYVFPQGGYSYLWSQNPMYDDLYTAWNKFRHNDPEIKALNQSVQQLIAQDDIADKFLKNAAYSKTDLVKAANPSDSAEIMMWCHSYYGIRSDYEYWEELNEIITT